MKEKILAHKKGMTALACVFLVFLGCFAFPVYNFSEAAPKIVRGSGIVIALLGYSEIGLLHSVLYRSKWKSAALTRSCSSARLALLKRSRVPTR